MQLGIGYLELVAILLCAVAAAVMYFMQTSQHLWYLSLVGCVTLATVLTPPDLSTTLIISAAFFAAYFFGTRHPTKPPAESV